MKIFQIFVSHILRPSLSSFSVPTTYHTEHIFLPLTQTYTPTYCPSPIQFKSSWFTNLPKIYRLVCEKPQKKLKFRPHTVHVGEALTKKFNAKIGRPWPPIWTKDFCQKFLLDEKLRPFAPIKTYVFRANKVKDEKKKSIRIILYLWNLSTIT